METMTRNIEMLTKTKVHNERQIKKLLEEKKEFERKIDEMTEEMDKKDKERYAQRRKSTRLHYHQKLIDKAMTHILLVYARDIQLFRRQYGAN